VRCDRARLLVPRLVDDELTPLRRWIVGRHVARCAACAGRMEEMQAMQAALRNDLPYHRVPPALAARIGAMLPREDVPLPPPVRRRAAALGFGAAGVAGALAGVALTLLVAGGSGSGTPNDAAVRGVIDAAIRSRMADHLTDVLTSDRHTVKPWLSARLDLSPSVPELKDHGFPLVGGRLDYVDGHPAAAVVYRHAQHVINLFAWAAPGTGNAGFRLETRRGFNVVYWRQDGISYYAVSDLEADQLALFARLVAGGG